MSGKKRGGKWEVVAVRGVRHYYRVQARNVEVASMCGFVEKAQARPTTATSGVRSKMRVPPVVRNRGVYQRPNVMSNGRCRCRSEVSAHV